MGRPRVLPPESRCMAVVPACGAVPEHRCPYQWGHDVDIGDGVIAKLCGRHARSAALLRIVSDRFLEDDPSEQEAAR